MRMNNMKKRWLKAITTKSLYLIAAFGIGCGGFLGIGGEKKESARVLIVENEQRCTQIEDGPNKGHYLCGRTWMVETHKTFGEMESALIWYDAQLRECRKVLGHTGPQVKNKLLCAEPECKDVVFPLSPP